jgi:hypothetical protein
MDLETKIEQFFHFLLEYFILRNKNIEWTWGRKLGGEKYFYHLTY